LRPATSRTRLIITLRCAHVQRSFDANFKSHPAVFRYVIPGLERYFGILRGEAVAKFQAVRRVEAERVETLDEMWKQHAALKEKMKELLAAPPDEVLALPTPRYSLLHLKVDILMEELKRCGFCSRACGVDRTRRKGFCGCGEESHYASEFLHPGEERELVPSHTIFFNGCTFRCVFCQNYDIVHGTGKLALPWELAALIDLRFSQGARNVNFVGGNPDQHAHTVLATLTRVRSNVPVVWNSNMYHSEMLAEVIEDVVDVWLGDFKYGNDECAERYSGVENYWQVVTRNFLRAAQRGEVIIRHLVMPSHLDCCTERIASWVAENMGPDVRFNLMFQYWPAYRADQHPEIARTLIAAERRRAMDIVRRHGLWNLA